MKLMRLSFMAIMLIMIVVAGAGCSSKPEVGSTVSSSSVFDTDYNWAKYQITNTIENETITIAKSTSNYQGVPAILQKITIESPSTGGSVMIDIYYDEEMKNILGGTGSTTIYGQTLTQSITPSELSDIDLFNQSIILTYQGAQSVSVPAGAYSDADLYTNSTTKGMTSYFVVSDIPVPVKIIEGGSQESLELISWG